MRTGGRVDGICVIQAIAARLAHTHTYHNTSRVAGVRASPRAGKGNSEMVNDGKFICKRFFANFEKLKREVESEEAFFFNDDGVYCQARSRVATPSLLVSLLTGDAPRRSGRRSSTAGSR